jgi:hypothetical protein
MPRPAAPARPPDEAALLTRFAAAKLKGAGIGPLPGPANARATCQASTSAAPGRRWRSWARSARTTPGAANRAA